MSRKTAKTEVPEAAADVWQRGEFEVRYTPASALTPLVLRKQGYIRGPWGLHKDGVGWRLTHLPTGRAAVVTWTLKEARDCARELDALGDWQALRVAYDGTWQSMARQVKKAQAICDRYRRRPKTHENRV